MRQPKILYVDAYDLVLFTVKQMLEAEGWGVDACRDGATALKKLTGDSHYDLLILDERLPGIGGLELLRRTRATVHLRRVPVIMFTASPCQHEARAAGVDAFLRKPSELGELVDTCRGFLYSDQPERELEAEVL